MASKKTIALALFLMVNLVFFNLVAACGGKCPPSITPSPIPRPGSCPKDALKLGICADVLGSLLNITVGDPPKKPCCSLIEGLVDLEAAVCLCTAIKLGVLGTKLDIPLSLSLLLNVCEKKVPSGFQCASN